MTLRDYLKKYGYSHTGFAYVVGCSPTTIGQIASCKIKPGEWMALKIENATQGKVKADELLKAKYPSRFERLEIKKQI